MRDDADDIECLRPSRTLNGALQGGVQGSNSSAHGSQYTDEATDQPQGHGDIRVGHCSTPLPHAFSCQLLSRSATTSVRGQSRQLVRSNISCSALHAEQQMLMLLLRPDGSCMLWTLRCSP